MSKLKKSGFKSLRGKLTKRATKAKSGDVEVGYTAAYAIFVHEMVGATFQRPGAQAKFLEQPLRTNKKKYVATAAKTMERGGTFRQGLLLAGLSLQRDSQIMVPIDTGNLRATAFTREVK